MKTKHPKQNFKKKAEFPKPAKPLKEELVRLNKFIANTGLCSRREADEYIKNGLVTVNGKLITELGVRIKSTDLVKFNGKTIKSEKKVYLLLNKPKDYVTTVKDPYSKKM